MKSIKSTLPENDSLGLQKVAKMSSKKIYIQFKIFENKNFGYIKSYHEV